MVMRIEKDRPFRIIGMTDTHIDGNAGCAEWTMRLIRETIAEEKPDLVVFAGDNVTGADNEGRAMAFTALMTELGVPWCPILGNHEGDNPGSLGRGQMMDLFRRSPCCMIPGDAVQHMDGRLDYTVRLHDADDKVCFMLIFMDGGAYMSEAEMKNYGVAGSPGSAYECLNGDQIAWYRAQVRECGCRSMVFCHIPLPEFRVAAAAGDVISGAIREDICCPPYNSGMFEVMAGEGSTVAFVSGHDHINDAHMMHRGIRLVYNRMSGLSSYNVISKRISDRLIQGCSVYSIYRDGNVEYDDILYEDRYAAYRNEIMNIIRR